MQLRSPFRALTQVPLFLELLVDSLHDVSASRFPRLLAMWCVRCITLRLPLAFIGSDFGHECLDFVFVCLILVFKSLHLQDILVHFLPLLTVDCLKSCNLLAQILNE